MNDDDADRWHNEGGAVPQEPAEPETIVCGDDFCQECGCCLACGDCTWDWCDCFKAGVRAH